eukprot:CAMPEP_0172899826 /NCGR_PEP_ID=MMETSP1075-20121228/162755_1 /TAXON_ID=2916 /ORGANISM="Ceratium fusus, Strain PA161109" /LENGTH=136 /DNA_ID=CAMNT_0013755893 /DNA_START=28 /DNA_END=438 /DNA_ORIENTATION=+
MAVLSESGLIVGIIVIARNEHQLNSDFEWGHWWQLRPPCGRRDRLVAESESAWDLQPPLTTSLHGADALVHSWQQLADAKAVISRFSSSVINDDLSLPVEGLRNELHGTQLAPDWREPFANDNVLPFNTPCVEVIR